MAIRIFLCYRTDVSADIGESIYNMLVSHYDSSIVIRETEHSGGESEPAKGDMLLIVLHPQWLRFIQETGTSFADWNRDFLAHRYLDGLLHPRINTILILADGANPPSRLQLPSNLQHLPNYDITSLPFSCSSSDHDANRLLHSIRTHTVKPRLDRWAVVLVGMLVLAAAICVAVVPFGKISLAIESMIPGRTDSYVYNGWLEYQNGNYENAVAQFEHATLILPSADAYEGLAWSYARLDQPEQAVTNFDRLVEASAGTDRGYGQRGWYFIGVKDFERALPDMEEAVNLNPEAADNYYGLGLAQDALGNTQSALEAYRQYLGLTSNPDSYVVDRVGELEQSADNP